MNGNPNDPAFWKSRYEAERERLVKLWVAYKTLERELEGERELERAHRSSSNP